MSKKLENLKNSLSDSKSSKKVMSNFEEFKSIFEFIQDRYTKGEKGDTGEQGPMPRKGVDYFTFREVEEFKKSVTPIKGVDYFDGIKGDKGEKGEQGATGDKGERGDMPIMGKDYFTPDQVNTFLKKITPVKGVDYFDGKDADEKSILSDIIEHMNIRLSEKEKKILDVLQKQLILMVQSVQSSGGGLGEEDVKKLISANMAHAKRIDLSAQCDGNVKTFTFTETFVAGSVQLFSTQFPIIYRPVVDFAENAGLLTITLTAEVGAPQTGQTLVAYYSH